MSKKEDLELTYRVLAQEGLLAQVEDKLIEAIKREDVRYFNDIHHKFVEENKLEISSINLEKARNYLKKLGFKNIRLVKQTLNSLIYEF